ncbi:alpha-amylase [bacterium]|nr:MAG: alpha-amylase [bacterium]
MPKAPRRVADLDLSTLRRPKGHTPSPKDWTDEVLYFLLVDRFSDENSDTPLARIEDRGNAMRTEEDAARWREAGTGFVGGNLKGIRQRLDYLKRLGITALWISPVLKQAPWSNSYHGYATQDFLSIEPRFGSAEDLRALVDEAHAKGMRVVLDIILNHAANVFTYEQPGPWTGEEYAVKGWNDGEGIPTIPFQKAATDHPDHAVWPQELQDPACFHCKGGIGDWDNDPEFREGDFFDLKDFHHGEGGLEDYKPSPALLALTEVYKYWIAYADLDGFRIDTVKHMDPGAVRYFSHAIRDFAASLGKCDFFLVGEVTGGRGFALDMASKTGLDAALEICGEPALLSDAAKGEVAPEEFFALTPEGERPREAHTVSIIDDHDQVCRGSKARFAADPVGAKLVLPSFALNTLTLGLPCVYYGSEQGFDGHGEGDDAERYIRESMFGGEFGAFGTRGVQFFDEESPTYKGLAAILKVRAEDPCLRRGRQYLREVSSDGEEFGLPTPGPEGPFRGIVAWSRTLDRKETLIAINTDPENGATAWVTVDGLIHQPSDSLRCAFCPGEGTEDVVTVEPRNGRAVRITLPPGGVAIYR